MPSWPSTRLSWPSPTIRALTRLLVRCQMALQRRRLPAASARPKCLPHHRVPPRPRERRLLPSAATAAAQSQATVTLCATKRCAWPKPRRKLWRATAPRRWRDKRWKCKPRTSPGAVSSSWVRVGCRMRRAFIRITPGGLVLANWLRLNLVIWRGSLQHRRPESQMLWRACTNAPCGVGMQLA